ncbi:MAG: hypothetical protein AABZ53_08190, partial [Planctomycetota bacterium]
MTTEHTRPAMDSPWRFGARLAAFLCMHGAIVAYLVCKAPSDTNHFLASVVEKHARADSIAAPRILFVGGSNLAFGLDSLTIERATGIPTVNLGLHAALGMEFMLCEARGVVRAGDTVVLSLEYEHFFGDITGDLLADVVRYRPELVGDLSLRLDKRLMDRAHIYLGRRMAAGYERVRYDRNPRSEVPYSRDGFNERGDLIAHRGLEQRPAALTARLSGHLAVIPPIDAHEPRRLLRQFVEYCDKRGVRVYYTFPPVSEENTRLFERESSAVVAVLRESGMPALLDTPQEVALPTACFFDTSYHLLG